jgi:protein XRP2
VSSEDGEGKAENQAPTYSWDKADRPDPKDLIFQDLNDVIVGKLPGTLNGNSFAIENCKNTKMYIFDYMGAITIDDCMNCDILLGPVKGSVFIRDCTDCRILASCHQFRTRDCRNLHINLHCCSQPVIESSTGMKFGRYQGNYNSFKEQFQSAQLSPFKNEWASIHDFTPIGDLENWSVMSQEEKPPLPPPGTESDLAAVGLTFDENYLPRTLGGIKYRPASQEGCVVGVSSSVKSENVLKWINALPDKVALVQTSEVSLNKEQVQQLFSASSPNYFMGSADTVSLILLEFSGSSCIDVLKQSLASSELANERVYVSPSTQQGQDDIQAWDNLTTLSFAP